MPSSVGLVVGTFEASQGAYFGLFAVLAVVAVALCLVDTASFVGVFQIAIKVLVEIEQTEAAELGIAGAP